FRAFWVKARDSLLLLPSAITAAGVGLAYSTIYLDENVGGPDPLNWWWVFGGGPESALSILSSISTSMITVTGLVFSLTVVALQLASSQYTPRVVRNFTGDISTQTVFGVFVATFTYALLIMGSVRVEGDEVEP